MNPLVRWVGSKRSILPTLVSLLPADSNERLYIEPFAGSAALFFGCGFKRSILSDTNEGLMALYFAAQASPEELITRLADMAHRHDAAPEYYFTTVREEYNRDLRTNGGDDAIGFAARFMYLQATGFNGVYRTNKAGAYNIPRGAVSNPRICRPAEIREAHRKLQGAGLVCGDFTATIPQAEQCAATFAYIDPPYDAEPGTKSFTAYSKSGFGPDHQVVLAERLTRFSAEGGKFLASNADTQLVRNLYAGYAITEVQGRRSVSKSGDGRGYVTELLIKNY